MITNDQERILLEIQPDIKEEIASVNDYFETKSTRKYTDDQDRLNHWTPVYWSLVKIAKMAIGSDDDGLKSLANKLDGEEQDLGRKMSMCAC